MRLFRKKFPVLHSFPPFCLILISTTTVLLLLQILETAAGVEAPIIKIDQGTLKGVAKTSRDGRPFYEFLGIPYGQVKRRFVESVLAPGWSGTRDASEMGSECAQRLLGGEEDCLHINVFTPSLPDGKSKKKLPVLFWVHGGAFILGSSNVYGAEYWMDEDCVVVTINYRLAVFGFLNLGIDEAPGNQGLKDQILALKWVQLNIAQFNGDKNKVTIFGESAGAASVSYLVLTPLSKGLFHRAVSQSGAAHPACPWSYNPDGVTHGLALAAKLNCGGGTPNDMVECLRKLDVHDLFEGYPGKLMPDMSDSKPEILTGMSFIPSVESRAASDKSTIFMPKPAVEIFKEGSFQDVPWMVGANEYEGFLFQSKLPHFKTLTELKAMWSKLGPTIVSVNGRSDGDEISEKVRKFYFDERTDITFNFTNLCSDRTFFVCTKMAAQLHAKKSPVYLYMFDKRGGFSLMTFMMHGQQPPRPTHADELTYQWKFNAGYLSGESDIEVGSQFYNFSKDFVKMWVHFAETGKPRDQWNSKKIMWNALKVGEPGGGLQWFHIDTDCMMKSEDKSFTERLNFWNDLNVI